jgi:outer membrane protein insertion porin family
MRYLTTREEKMKESLKSKESQYLDYPTLAEDVQTIKKMYEKIGYGSAEIQYKVDLDAQTGKAKVNFNIAEGKKTRIKSIFVEGNKAFSDKRILKLIKTKRAWFFNAGLLKEETFQEDIERVRSFYQRAGFADVVVEYTIKREPGSPLLYITIKIDEGTRYLVGNVTVTGNKDVPEKTILATLTVCVPGKVFSQEGVKQDVAAIHGVYFDRGYISAGIQNTTAVNPQTGRVDVVYTIMENDVSYVDKIKIRGNTRTRDVVIRRELRIKPGDKFDGEKLRRSKERLQNLGFFDEQEGIAYDVEDTDVPNKKDLIVDVKEAKTGAFSFGGGYSTVDKLVGFVEVEQKNFDWKNWPYFTGAGQDLRLRASLGSVSEGFELSFTNPWVFDYPVSFGFDVYRRTHSKDQDVGYSYDENVTGGDLRLGKELSEYLKADWMYRLDSVGISNIDATVSQGLKDEVGTNIISSMQFGLTFDDRDNIFYSTKGNLLSGSMEFAGGPLAGDRDFWKFFGRASHYFPLPRKSVLEVRGRVGVGDAYGSSKDIPIYERFFAGGAYTVRGYDERSIGPVDPLTGDPLGGDALAVGNIEYTYPLLDFLKVAAFYDVGNVWAKSSEIFSGGYKSGVGLGIRIKTPLGPMMLDYGIPLDKESGKETRGNGKIHFNVSRGF